MARVSVLFPKKSAEFYVDNPHQLPYESRLTPAQAVLQGPKNRLSVMKRHTNDRSIIDNDTMYKLHVMNMPKRKQTPLEYKQPSLIKIPFGVSRNEYVNNVANKVLNRQFLKDRAATTGELDSQQIIAKNDLTFRTLDAEKIPETISFQNAPTVIRANNTARREANLFNSAFTSTGRSSVRR